MGKLTDKQEKFCIEHAVNPDPIESAIIAGFSKRTAKAHAKRLLAKESIQERIAEIIAGVVVEPNKTGAPPKYSTDEELSGKINEYFNDGGCKKRKVIVGRGEDKKSIEMPIPTITGLAYFLGFESRQSFYDYGNRDEFSYTIKRARLFIEVEYEEQLQVGNTTGAIFALKNMGWKDKTEVEQTTIPPPKIIFSDTASDEVDTED